jgi:uncharacterized radical SAM superfamily Fe-S cluster-containing enzyme
MWLVPFYYVLLHVIMSLYIQYPAQLLGLKIRQNMQHESKLYQRNVVKLACNQTVRLAFRRDDLLTNISVAIEETFPQVLVINRGAHFINDTRFVPALRRNLEEINDWYGKCHGMNMTCHLFWRSTVSSSFIDIQSDINNIVDGCLTPVILVLVLFFFDRSQGIQDAIK